MAYLFRFIFCLLYLIDSRSKRQVPEEFTHCILFHAVKDVFNLHIMIAMLLVS